MENILNAAKEAVSAAKRIIVYYEKEIEQKQKSLEDAKEKAATLESEYEQLMEKVK